jgi:hypothetical protein
MRFYAHDSMPDQFPDADVIIMAHRTGLAVSEVPVVMYPSRGPNPPMHGGLKRISYVFNMMVSILVTILRSHRQDLREPGEVPGDEPAGGASAGAGKQRAGGSPSPVL